MKPRGGKGRLVFGTLLICAAVFLIVYNMRESDRAGEESSQILSVLDEVIEENVEDVNNLPYPIWDPLIPEEVERVMPTEEIYGYRYIGVLEIPGLDLSLPVMEEWDETRLRISPCRYTGSYYTDDLVICGHNYATHFSAIKWIDIGEKVIFRAVDGIEYRYIVTNREVLQPKEVDAMIDSEAEWDLTLFTCTTGGQTRCTVRCERSAEK